MKKIDKPIFVTRPSLPPLEDFVECLKELWETKWLTHDGRFHKEFEKAICEYLDIDYCTLFCNGTLALQAALAILNLEGEVITTPFTFAATANAIVLSGLKPVFVDIDPDTFNISPESIRKAVTDKTSAIMPVHVYGNPCDTMAIDAIADQYNLKVIYDGAHAFGVKQEGASILSAGDMTMVSFHATKIMNSIEGGAIITNNSEYKRKLDLFRFYGLSGETSTELIGTNAKMNEVQAAMGLLNLRNIDDNIACRRALAEKYRELLADVDGIKVLNDFPGVRHNYAYFPILVDEKRYGMSRDELCDKLKEHNIFARRYFYPLLTDFSAYNDSNCRIEELPVAKRTAKQVLCLPLHTELTEEQIRQILENIASV
ncbi:MAG: DegT/DnrJ/EryC1/StrS family aminotransferase [Phycisphaerae bacterium]